MMSRHDINANIGIHLSWRIAEASAATRMSTEGIDPNRLAELLSGSLPRDERNQIIAELLQDPVSYEHFVTAARAKLQLESEMHDAEKTAAPERRALLRHRLWIPLAAAAAA